MKEGVFLQQHGFDPYAGGVFYHVGLWTGIQLTLVSAATTLLQQDHPDHLIAAHCVSVDWSRRCGGHDFGEDMESEECWKPERLSRRAHVCPLVHRAC